ncbi:MAG: PEP/pyruvate-binding domain-containing protein [Pseudomonadota bacterium]
MKSKALEVNLADYHVDVVIDEKYSALQEIMADYFGLMKRLTVFLKELSHPYKNWEFIVSEARSVALGYFHLLRPHPRGPEAARLLTGIFLDAIGENDRPEIRTDAADNLILFLQHMASESKDRIEAFFPVIDHTLESLDNADPDTFFLFVRSYYPPERMLRLSMGALTGQDAGFTALNRFLYRCHRFSFDYWLSLEDPYVWIRRENDAVGYDEAIETLLSPTSHARIQALVQDLEQVMADHDPASRDCAAALLALPGYKDFVKLFLDMPRKIHDLISEKVMSRRLELLFLFYIMNTPGLSMIHEQALQDINRALTWLIGHEAFRNNQKLIDKTFDILRSLASRFPPTVLNCVLKTGEAIYKTEEVELINYFIDRVFDLGFHSPMIRGISNDWQVIGNSAHIQNIRTWLELIGQKPKMSARLLSALIIFLTVGGVFIRDTDLFPRDLTGFLGKNIAPVYSLVKQLARLLPVFFNEIGAEGELREISTQLDESCQRKDELVHFLRKQSHVESSSRVVSFMEEVIRFWTTGNKAGLALFVPPSIFEQVHEAGEYVDGMHTVMAGVADQGIRLPGDLLKLGEDPIRKAIEQVPGTRARDRERAFLAASFYRLLNQKYNFDNIQFGQYLDQLASEDLPDIKYLKDALAETDIKRKLTKLLRYLEQLKELILSPRQFEVRENMYHKRHIAVDIPSVYGSYHEARFDAMGLTLRIESIVNVLFEELINSIDLSLITKATFSQILDILILFGQALKVDGITSNKMKVQFELLIHSIEIREFSSTQYIDIFKGFSMAVKNILDDHFHNIHARNMRQIVTKIPLSQIMKKFLPAESIPDRKKLGHRVAEIFFREHIVRSLGLQQLDVFLKRILSTLFKQSETLTEARLNTLFNYDSENAVTRIGGTKTDIHHIIYLGNKGFNLIELKNLGWRVPPGFIITTEAFRCRELIDSYGPARDNFRKQITDKLAHMERVTGRSFGNPANPLLLSVRSGSSISQPGMLDSYTNVGINETIAESMAHQYQNAWFAWDCYRRFLQGYGMSFGVNRDGFDAIMAEFKLRKGVPLKMYFTGEQMKELSFAYRAMILDSGITIVEDPMEQLYLAIKKVFSSWNSSRAKAYRQIMGISNEWGTAVTVQKMVFGNLSRKSGSGVFFTHSPRLPGDTLRLWGDFTIGNQGEDVVAGLVRTLAISEMQREIEHRGTDITLETGFPELYRNLKAIAQEMVYDRGWDPQEMEFTFESPHYKDLYLLQTRDMSVRERKLIRSFDLNELTSGVEYLGRGIGVSGGPMSGRIVFSLDEIRRWRDKEPKTDLILIRGDTVSDDILEIDSADGIITARGGVTSHAAIVAFSLKKTCVVGCENLNCYEKESRCLFGNTWMKAGDYISVDGREGSIYRGFLSVNEI